MHIRVTPGQIQPAKVQESLTVMRELFAAYREGVGFRQGYVAIDEGSGEGMVVTLWDSEERALAATRRTGPLLAKLGPLTVAGQTPVPPRAYEILLEG